MMTTSIEETAVREALRLVLDPELDCNIVDLGLVYGVVIDGAKVVVTMTLTTPGCPMHESIVWGVQCALLELEGVEDVDVQVVWEPAWTPARMSPAGRERTGVVDDNVPTTGHEYPTTHMEPCHLEAAVFAERNGES